jgi:hypothetical protein
MMVGMLRLLLVLVILGPVGVRGSKVTEVERAVRRVVAKHLGSSHFQQISAAELPRSPFTGEPSKSFVGMTKSEWQWGISYWRTAGRFLETALPLRPSGYRKEDWDLMREECDSNAQFAENESWRWCKPNFWYQGYCGVIDDQSVSSGSNSRAQYEAHAAAATTDAFCVHRDMLALIGAEPEANSLPSDSRPKYIQNAIRNVFCRNGDDFLRNTGVKSAAWRERNPGYITIWRQTPTGNISDRMSRIRANVKKMALCIADLADLSSWGSRWTRAMHTQAVDAYIQTYGNDGMRRSKTVFAGPTETPRAFILSVACPLKKNKVAVCDTEFNSGSEFEGIKQVDNFANEIAVYNGPGIGVHVRDAKSDRFAMGLSNAQIGDLQAVAALVLDSTVLADWSTQFNLDLNKLKTYLEANRIYHLSAERIHVNVLRLYKAYTRIYEQAGETEGRLSATLSKAYYMLSRDKEAALKVVANAHDPLVDAQMAHFVLSTLIMQSVESLEINLDNECPAVSTSPVTSSTSTSPAAAITASSTIAAAAASSSTSTSPAAASPFSPLAVAGMTAGATLFTLGAMHLAKGNKKRVRVADATPANQPSLMTLWGKLPVKKVKTDSEPEPAL